MYALLNATLPSRVIESSGTHAKRIGIAVHRVRNLPLFLSLSPFRVRDLSLSRTSADLGRHAYHLSSSATRFRSSRDLLSKPAATSERKEPN